MENRSYSPKCEVNPEITRLIQKMGRQYEENIITWRRHLHRHPEPDACEIATSLFLRQQLDALGMPYRLVEGKLPAPSSDGRMSHIGTGIIATIKGKAPGAYGEDGSPAKCVVLRADMDALHVTENTSCDYASVNEGLMHACGHDCHMAMMLGTAHMLSELNTNSGIIRYAERCFTCSDTIFSAYLNIPNDLR